MVVGVVVVLELLPPPQDAKIAAAPRRSKSRRAKEKPMYPPHRSGQAHWLAFTLGTGGIDPFETELLNINSLESPTPGSQHSETP
jgi:hypothetical protein